MPNHYYEDMHLSPVETAVAALYYKAGLRVGDSDFQESTVESEEDGI